MAVHDLLYLRHSRIRGLLAQYQSETRSEVVWRDYCVSAWLLRTRNSEHGSPQRRHGRCSMESHRKVGLIIAFELVITDSLVNSFIDRYRVQFLM